MKDIFFDRFILQQFFQRICGSFLDHHSSYCGYQYNEEDHHYQDNDNDDDDEKDDDDHEKQKQNT